MISKKFEQILQTSRKPIASSALPGLLGIQDAQWVLDEYRSSLITSRDGILPEGAQEAILTSFRKRIEQDFVIMESFLAFHGINAGAFDKILDKHARIRALVMEVPSSEDAPSYACRKNLWQIAQEDILKTMTSAGDTPIDIAFPRMPDSLVDRIAKELISDSRNELRGQVERSSSGVHFIPEAAQLKHQNEKQRKRESLVNATADTLHKQGFYIVPQTLLETSGLDRELAKTFIDDVVAAHQIQYPETEVVELRPLPNDAAQVSAAKRTALVTPTLLEARQKHLAERAAQLVEEIWDNRALDEDLPQFSDSLDAKICSAEGYAELDRCIFHSAGGNHLGAVFANAFEELRQDAAEKAGELLRLRLLSPAALYATGVEGITDSTLQARIAEFVRDHLKELAAGVAVELEEQKAIASKTAYRDIDKFAQNAASSTSLDDVRSAIAKLVRKQKLSQPGPEVLAETKRDVLKQKTKAMKRMKRGSDLLQNLVWLLLASKREGLFMSSGKDTSRMIKLYQQTEGADEEASKSLNGLRDVVKAGKETDEDKERMRVMAGACLG